MSKPKNNSQTFQQKAVSRVMSGTTCCISLISRTTPHFLVATFTAILFFPQESNLKCRKDLRKALRLVRQWWQRAHVVSFRDSVSVRQHYSSNPEPEEKPRKPRVQSEDSGGLAEMYASGNREYTRKVIQNIRDQLRHDASISEISIYFEKMHISMWTRFMASSMQAALHMDPSYEQNLEFFKNSEIKKEFSANVASSLWEKLVLLKEQAVKWTKARVYVYSDSVLCLGNSTVQKMQ